MTEATRKREGPTPEQLAQRARFEGSIAIGTPHARP